MKYREKVLSGLENKQTVLDDRKDIIPVEGVFCHDEGYFQPETSLKNIPNYLQFNVFFFSESCLKTKCGMMFAERERERDSHTL
jgi:hypothetical protein